MKTRTILAALVWALAFTTTVVNAADALPSWNDGTAEQSIADFFAKVNKEGSPDFVPPAERIAVFDNDGTLWAQHPEWKDKEPFASLLKSDLKAPLAQNAKALIEILMATHAGLTTDEFDKMVKDWLATTSLGTGSLCYGIRMGDYRTYVVDVCTVPANAPCMLPACTVASRWGPDSERLRRGGWPLACATEIFQVYRAVTASGKKWRP